MSTHPSGVRAGHSFGRVVEKVGPFRAGLALLFRPHLQAVCCDCAMSACRQGLPLRMFISPCVGFALWPMFFLLLDRTHLYKQIAAPWDASSRPLERKELLQQGKTHSELRGDHPLTGYWILFGLLCAGLPAVHHGRNGHTINQPIRPQTCRAGF